VNIEESRTICVANPKILVMPIDKFEISKSGLVLIDLQNGILDRPVQPHSSQDVLERASKFADWYREKGGTVFLVHVITKQGEGITSLVDQPRPASKLPDDWSNFPPKLGPKDGDVVIGKKNWGAFYGTDLDLQLRRRGIETILLGGIATNMGVESTARSAHEHNYNTIFLEDVTSSFSIEEHEFAFTKIFPKIGRVSSTSEITKLF
jgi:nicotinamidase-related amidase